MTMERYTRCWHCRGQYLRLVSGSEGYNTNHTDDRFCPDCLEVVVKALESVPTKKPVRLQVLYPTVAMLVSERERIDREQKQKPNLRAGFSFPNFRQVFLNEFDLKDMSNHNFVNEVRYETCKFRYSYWTKTGMENGTVSFEAEVSDDGTIVPWGIQECLFKGMQFIAPDGSVRTI